MMILKNMTRHCTYVKRSITRDYQKLFVTYMRTNVGTSKRKL